MDLHLQGHKFMFAISLIFLAILSFYVMSNSVVISIVLGGLLWIVAILHTRLEQVRAKLSALEEKVLELRTSPSSVVLRPDMSLSESPIDEDLENEKPPLQEPSFVEDKAADVKPVEPDDLAPSLSADEAFAKQQAELNEQNQSEASYASHQPLARQSDAVSTSVSAKLSEELENATADTQHSDYSTVRPEPAQPRGPNFIEKLIAAAWNWVTDGNVFVRVGIIVLFMGMTFLTRYAIDQNMISIEARLAAIGAVGVGLLFWGWRQRDLKRNFSLVVQGGGIGLLYLTVFAGFSLYDVIPSTIAFILLALIVIFAAILAVSQDAKPLALFATIGGFLAPILTSSGNNNYVGLFSYYSLLNLGIFAVAWFRSWRILNFIGFIFTFLVSTVWGVLSYEKEFFSSTEPFLVLFFLLYVGIGILFAHKRTPFYKDYVDSSLIFGTPIFAFGLQCAMVKDFEYGVAISAAVLGVFYLVLASILWKKYGARLRLLTETFLSLGVIFATLAIPFAVDGYLSAAAWAIEGTGILWVSVKQQEKYRRFFATALIFAAGLMLLYGMKATQSAAPFINSFFIGCIIITVAATIASWLLAQDFAGKVRGESTLADMLIVYALGTLLGGFELEIYNFSLFTVHGSLLALLSGISILVYTMLAGFLHWPKGNWVSVWYVVPLSVAAVLCFTHQSQLSQHFGYLLWPAVLVIAFYGLKRAIGLVDDKSLVPAHILLAATIVGLLFWEGIWQLMLGYSVLAILFNHLSNRFEWPQLKVLALGFFPVLVVCSLFAIRVDGDLVTLSNFASSTRPPFPPGIVLWPFSFAVYFYLVYQNRNIGGANNKYLHYAGAALIGALLLWLGQGPLLLGASLLAIVFCGLWKRFNWPEMRIISMALLPLMLLVTAVKFVDGSFHVTEFGGLGLLSANEPGFLLWPLGFIALFWTYWQYDKGKQSASAFMLNAAILLPVMLITWEVSWHLLDHLDLFNAWHMAWLPIASMSMTALIYKAQTWPFKLHKEALRDFAVPCLVLVPIAWSFLQLLSSGSSSPLPWMPIANPLDVVQIIILLGACFWGPKLVPDIFKAIDSRQIFYAILGCGFLWANVELLRTLHHWVGIPWVLPTIISADISQTVIALFWALGGLVLTTFASKKDNRTLWFFGGALLVAVVLKLFLVDLTAQDTIERIVSFTGVGLLLVAVGYFSPLPPKDSATEHSNTGDGFTSEEKLDA